jgi:superfamily II DNA or RNA helicase
MTLPDDLTALRAENQRLIALLDQHGIAWRVTPEPVAPPSAVEPLRLTTAEKVALFRKRFRGRTDIYPVRWEGKTSGKSGYAPACGNEWRPGVCEKPRIRCGDCSHRVLMPLTDEVIYRHLTGDHTIGVYPLLADDTCHFFAVDFDEAEWREDAQAFSQSCAELGVPMLLEISRSGQGAHVWIFFDRAVSARDARRLGTAIISHTCARTRQLKLTSYDRLFPSQDTLPKGGFGNLIALPLQKKPREDGFSVFVDADLNPCPDPWAVLAGATPLSAHDIEPTILRATGGRHPLDVTFIDEEDLATPWKRRTAPTGKLTGELPSVLTVTMADRIYFDKAQLPQALANRLIRLAAFQNPEFYRAQAMRKSVWNTARVIGCAENFPQHIALPRGCFDAAAELLADNDIGLDLRDERHVGESIRVDFAGALRLDQEIAVAAMLRHETGVLCAPTAFGKTVTAAAMIARRGVNTLVLVHRIELLRQWQERLAAFLNADTKTIGALGGGKDRLTGKIDIAVMQSLSRSGGVDPRVENYGQVIVDECHHIGAKSFDAILRCAKAKYVVGLTATPIRRDGQQPVIFIQCGPIRHKAAQPAGAPQDLAVVPRYVESPLALPPDAGIQEVFRHLAQDSARTRAIAQAVIDAFSQGRKVLVLTERTEHIEALRAALAEDVPTLFVLHGRMPKKQRAMLTAALDALPTDAPRVLLATGKLVGEGFDHPPLDTLVLAMPVSWKGLLQQYAGRLHREHTGKTVVRVIDFVDTGHPALRRMWDRRQGGYRAMGYRFCVPRLARRPCAGSGPGLAGSQVQNEHETR